MSRGEQVVVLDERHPRSDDDPVSWALGELAAALARSGVQLVRAVDAPELPAEGFRIRRSGSAVTIAAPDTRGAMYAVLDIVDGVTYATGPDEVGVLDRIGDQDGRPANRVRSLTRIFSSRAEDSGWFHDRRFWDEYLTDLATHRFNRFSFGTGPGNDFTIDKKVRDSYLQFLYPYVVTVPGYDVEIDGVDAAERARNLAALRYVARETTRRGLDFHLGLWNHAYRYDPDDDADPLRITGIDDTNHAAYCRDALATLLAAVPEIRGLTFRVHVEGGIREPTHEFWRVVLSRLGEFPGLTDVDFHAKGVGEELIRATRESGKRATLSPKYWGEHMGLPYHQASIRRLERDPSERIAERGTRLANATGHHESVTGWQETARRSFTRYGYADFLTEDRPYEIVYRVWPGTQRFLSWGDPAAAAAVGREASFGGAAGIEWFDMMTFKGRKDSGMPGGRELYRDPELALGPRDWTKHRYATRLRGRLAYDPQEKPESWRRHLRSVHGGAWPAVERALAAASRVLPLVFTTHGPSTACAMYWPEMYTNVPIVPVPPVVDNPYAERGWPPDLTFDSKPPHTFGSVGSLDPEVFAGVDEYADRWLGGTPDGRYSPWDVADLFDRLARDASQSLDEAETLAGPAPSADYRRIAADVRILAGIAEFFAAKFRAAWAFAVFQRTGDRNAGDQAVAHYRNARAAWERAAAAGAVYRDDLAFGGAAFQRGHWSDRLDAIDADIAALAREVGRGVTVPPRLIPEREPRRATGFTVRHDTPLSFTGGSGVPVLVHADGAESVRLHYRPVNQAEEYRVLPLSPAGTAWAGEIPGDDIPADRALQYYVEVIAPDGAAANHPDLGPDLCGRPYFVVSPAKKDPPGDEQRPDALRKDLA